MEIEPFTDQYKLAAELYGVSEDELRRRDRAIAPKQQRWLAMRSGSAVGAATAWLRPDNRMFVAFECRELSAYGPLAEAASAVSDGPLFTMVDEDDRPGVVALRAAGFTTDFVEERFRVRFDPVLERFRNARVPPGFTIESAADVDEARLFTLDNTIRNDVPGTLGWRGDRDWFHEELTRSPPFDAAAYPVAVDTGNGEYVGLARIWRDEQGPRFGMVGVIRQYRGTTLAAALILHALTAASKWGHETFTVEASPANQAIASLLQELEAERLGRSLRLIRR